MIKNIIAANEKLISNQKELDVLREIFPSCFHDDGTFDMQLFSGFLKDKIDISHEGYELKFLGKNYAKMLASLDTETVIIPDDTHNNLKENKNSENIYISGDNLDGLKHLLKSYSGQVKCIYIDPPYNTGSDGFVYNDKFDFKVSDLVQKLSVNEEQAQHILNLTRRGSASHSAWLMFMYPRLQLARNLLASDGAIFISIDDNEQSNLKLICDDIFGEHNFAGQIAVVNNLKGRNDRANIATTHEYLLMYVTEKFVSGGLPLTEEQKQQYKYIDENGNQYALRDLRKRGRPDRREDRPNMYFPIYYNEETKELSITKKTGFVKIVPRRGDGSDGRWRWGKDHVASSLEILHPEKNGDKWSIKHRVYLKPALNPIISDDEFDEFDDDDERTSKAKSFWQGGELSTDVARRTLKELIPGAEFDYPKSVELIKRVLHMGLSGNCEGIVCDFFGGSATTMQAIMEFNVENQSNIKGIIIQLQETMDDKIINANGEALSALKKNIKFLDAHQREHTLDYLGIERLLSVSKMIKEKNADTLVDLGFKHYILKDYSTDDVLLDEMEKFDSQESMLTDKHLIDKFGVETALITWMVDDGYGFNANLQKIDLSGYTAYKCGQHLYLLNEGFSNQAMNELIKNYHNLSDFNMNEVVAFGYSFNWTELEMLKTNLKALKDDNKNLSINVEVRY